MKLHIQKIGLVVVLLFAFVTFISPILVNAQAFRGLIFSSLVLEGNPTGSLIYEVELAQPGETVTGNFVITHDFDNNNQPISVLPRAIDFTQGSSPGAPLFIEANELPEASRLSEWITFDQNVYQLPERGAQATVSFEINIPENADAGGKFAGILLGRTDLTEDDFADDQEQANVNFALNGETGPLILLTVDGDINKRLELADLYTTDVKNNKSWFFFNLPVNLVADFYNSGNTYLPPRGRVLVHRGEDYTNPLFSSDLNPVEDGYRDYILPETNRTFTTTWNESFIKTVKNSDGSYSTEYDFDNLSKLRIGNYTFTLLYDYVDETGTTVNLPIRQVSVFVLPLPLVILIIALIVIVIGYILARKHLKRDTK